MDVSVPLLLAIGVAAGIWALVCAQRLPSLHACLALLLAASCFSVSFSRWEFGPVTMSIDRMLLVAVVGLAGLKRLISPQPRLQFDRYDLTLAALLFVLAISLWTHPAPPKRSETSPSPSYLFAASFLGPALVYWIARYRQPHWRDARVLCVFFALFGLYAAFTAVCEVHRLSAFVFPKYILQERVLYAGRAVGPCLSSPSLGTWLTVAAVAAVLLWNQSRGALRWLLVLLLPLVVYAEYLTSTRSAWMGFVVAVPLAALLSGSRMMRQLLFVVMIGGALVFGLFAGEEFLVPDRAEGRSVVAHSSSQRLALMQRSIALFVQCPLHGWGFGQFEHESSLHGGGGPIQLVSSDAARGLASHNTLLRFIAETGVIGTVPFVALFWLWLSHARRTLKTAPAGSAQQQLAILFLCTLIAYVAEAMFHDVTFIRQDNLLIYFLAGCLLSGLPSAAASAQANQTEVAPRLSVVRWDWPHRRAPSWATSR